MTISALRSFHETPPTKQCTYLVLFQAPKLLDKPVVRVLPANGRGLEGHKVLDEEPKAHKTGKGHGEMPHGGVRVDDGDVGAPHREELFLLVDLKRWRGPKGQHGQFLQHA